MPTLPDPRSRPSLARDVLVVAMACTASVVLFTSAFSFLAGALAPQVAEASPAWLPSAAFAVTAVLSGLCIGVAVVLVLPGRSRFVLGWSAGLVCALSFGAAVLGGGVGWSLGQFTVALGPLLAFGFSLAGLFARKARHA